MIDLAAAVTGLGQHAQRHDREEIGIKVERAVGEAPEVAEPPQRDPGGDAGERQAEERVQREIAVGIDHRLGNSRSPAGSISAHIEALPVTKVGTPNMAQITNRTRLLRFMTTLSSTSAEM